MIDYSILFSMLEERGWFPDDRFKNRDCVMQTGADLTLKSIPLSRGLFEVFLGVDSVVPEAKKQWAQGARNLLETDRVQKDTRGGAF